MGFRIKAEAPAHLAVGGEAVHFSADVVDLEGKVMKACAALRQVVMDGSGVALGRDEFEFDLIGFGGEKRGGDVLSGNGLPFVGGPPQEAGDEFVGFP